MCFCVHRLGRRCCSDSPQPPAVIVGGAPGSERRLPAWCTCGELLLCCGPVLQLLYCGHVLLLPQMYCSSSMSVLPSTRLVSTEDST